MSLLDGIAKALAKKIAPSEPLTAAQPDLVISTGIGVVDGILSTTSITVTMNGSGLLPCNCATNFTPTIGQSVFVQIYGSQLYAVCPVS